MGSNREHIGGVQCELKCVPNVLDCETLGDFVHLRSRERRFNYDQDFFLSFFFFARPSRMGTLRQS